MIKALIIDDEQNAVDTLQLMLKKYCHEVDVIRTANSLMELHEKELKGQIDVVFLDINLGEYSGFDLLDKVNFSDSKIVFVTAHDQYGVKAVKSGAFDYILKPINPNELIETVNKLIREKLSFNEDKKENKSEYIMIPVNNTYTRIEIKEVTHIEADGSYSILHELNKKYFCSKTLKYFEELLSANDFFRIHHSYLVRIDKIKSIKMGRDKPLILINGLEIPVARNKKKELMKILSLK